MIEMPVNRFVIGMDKLVTNTIFTSLLDNLTCCRMVSLLILQYDKC